MASGESFDARRRVQNFVTRAAYLYNLDSVTVWSPDGGLLAANENIIGNMSLHLSNFPMRTPRSALSGLVSLGGQLWAVSTAPVYESPDEIFILQFSRLLDERIAEDDLLGVGLKIQPKAAVESEEAALLQMRTVDGSPLQVSLSAKEPIIPSGLQSKVYVAAAISAACLILFVVFVVTINRESRPFRALQAAFLRVGQGDFSQRVEVKGCNEAVDLANSFNRMVADLLRLRTLEQVVQQERQLAAAGRIAARVAHDLNNPISVIRSISDIARRRYRGQHPVGEDMETIFQQSSRCLQIAENLVAFTRPQKVELAVLDLNEKCREYLKGRRRHSRRFQYHFIASPQPLCVLANKHYLWQILDNLTDNALEANGGRPVEYRCHRQAGYAVVSIRDNGAGFPEDCLNDVFQLFFTTKPEGSGLGLPNALSIAHALGGTIRITDAAAGEISVYLRLAEAANVDPMSLRTPYASVDLTSRSLEIEHV